MIEQIFNKKFDIVNSIDLANQIQGICWEYLQIDMIMKNYVADELSNKVYHLHKALEKAQEIISILETENTYLKKLIENMDQHKMEPVAA